MNKGAAEGDNPSPHEELIMILILEIGRLTDILEAYDVDVRTGRKITKVMRKTADRTEKHRIKMLKWIHRL